MTQYHGDIGQFGNSFYRSDEGGKIVVAVILLLLLGFTGAHRFYLDEVKHGMFHLCALLVVLISLLSFAFSVAIIVAGLQALVLLIELVFFFIRAATGR